MQPVKFYANLFGGIYEALSDTYADDVALEEYKKESEYYTRYTEALDKLMNSVFSRWDEAKNYLEWYNSPVLDAIYKTRTLSCICAMGNIPLLEWILKKDQDILVQYLDSCYSRAAAAGQLDVLKWLYTNVPSSSSLYYDDHECVKEALINEYTEAADWLITNFPFVVTSISKENLLGELYARCNHRSAEWLLNKYPDINTRYAYLHGFPVAAQIGSIEGLKYIQENVDLSEDNTYVRDAVFCAIEKGHTHCIEFLLDKYPYIVCPFHIQEMTDNAARYSQYDVLIWLTNRFGELNQGPERDNCTLAWPANFDNLEMVKWLIEKHQDTVTGYNNNLWQHGVFYTALRNDSYRVMNYMYENYKRFIKPTIVELRTIIRFQSFETIKFLLVRFRFDDMVYKNLIMECVVVKKSLELIQLFVEYYPDIVIKGNDCFVNSMKYNCLDICKWLVAKYPDLDVSKDNHDGFFTAVYNDSYDCVLWYLEKYPDFNPRFLLNQKQYKYIKYCTNRCTKLIDSRFPKKVSRRSRHK